MSLLSSSPSLWDSCIWDPAVRQNKRLQDTFLSSFSRGACSWRGIHHGQAHFSFLRELTVDGIPVATFLVLILRFRNRDQESTGLMGYAAPDGRHNLINPGEGYSRVIDKRK